MRVNVSMALKLRRSTPGVGPQRRFVQRSDLLADGVKRKFKPALKMT
jgi:hypothetical protein